MVKVPTSEVLIVDLSDDLQVFLNCKFALVSSVSVLEPQSEKHSIL